MNHIYWVQMPNVRSKDDSVATPIRVPFECEYPTAEAFAEALRGGSVRVRQVYFEDVPQYFRMLKYTTDSLIERQDSPVVTKFNYRLAKAVE